MNTLTQSNRLRSTIDSSAERPAGTAAAATLGRLLICLLIVCALFLPGQALASTPPSLDPADAILVRGTIDVTGQAMHPTFRKWQLDLLIEGEADNATFIAWGAEEATGVTSLAQLDTTNYPDGIHLLRLRVVHSNLNYDEFFSTLRIVNSGRALGRAHTSVRVPSLGPTADPAGTTPTDSRPRQASDNGIAPLAGVASGTVALAGVANHPNLRKWQIDFLVDSDPALGHFVALGTEAVVGAQELVQLDTTLFPNGEHLLRLRVVRSDTNYDEYLTPITIDNALIGPLTQEETLPAPILDTSLAPAGGYRLIEVDLTDQTLSAWQGDVRVLHTRVSTGRPDTPTVLGRYRVRVKLPSQHMRGEDYSLPDVPAVMYFYQGYAIHGAYWHNNFGQVMSHGCVNMRPDEAQALYDWAEVGTEVYVHD